MKKLTTLLAGMMIFGMTATAMAQEEVQQDLVTRIRASESVAVQEERKEEKESFSQRLKKAMAEEQNKNAAMNMVSTLPKVAIIYINNAKSTYDAEVDNALFRYLNKSLPEDVYELVDGAPYAEKLNKLGYMDIADAERADIVDAFAGEGIDYCIYLEVQPFVARDKMTFFTVGKDITTAVPFKMIDLVNNKYLYVGKYTEKASDSTMIGGIGNKSVALKALNTVGQKIAAVIDVRLPKEKAEAVK
ncbi:MAG: hypothetical protein Q4E64_11020 [Phascolarctobacterium sp.]|uniref:hypothetical protein n=1 Tax=Phascolarctobacterium sp. TaxID=2049039 RepID=UPI0026DCC034|nr:hypothetical protein [Phascolarctobacterium sp.]MDO4922339.1 hypothetical protein [Phascolarctobacterium sp.]